MSRIIEEGLHCLGELQSRDIPKIYPTDDHSHKRMPLDKLTKHSDIFQVELAANKIPVLVALNHLKGQITCINSS
jgi:hypothetical protein